MKNTDAEGRLILADALAYATSKLRPKPKAVVDLATLTGACVVALGRPVRGSRQQRRRPCRPGGRGRRGGGGSGLAPADQRGLPQAAEERLRRHRQPRDAPGGGTITAAAFLEKFVGTVPWAHLDIAGIAWTEREDGYLTKGGTGAGVRLLCRLLAGWKR